MRGNDALAMSDLVDELADEMAARRGEDRVDGADAVEPAEQRALQRHVLGHRLDDELGVPRLLEPRRRLDAGERRLARGLAHQPVGDELRRARADLGPRRRQALGLAPDEPDAPAAGGEDLGDAVADDAVADDGDRPSFRVCRHAAPPARDSSS